MLSETARLNDLLFIILRIIFYGIVFKITNELIKLSFFEIFVKRFGYLFEFFILTDVTKFRLFVITGRVTVKPYITTGILTVFVKWKQYDIINCINSQNNHCGTGNSSSVIKIQINRNFLTIFNSPIHFLCNFRKFHKYSYTFLFNSEVVMYIYQGNLRSGFP